VAKSSLADQPDSLAKPACAPSAAPTGWSGEVGTQTIVDPA
jgi:hypothetical protein